MTVKTNFVAKRAYINMLKKMFEDGKLDEKLFKLLLEDELASLKSLGNLSFI